MAKILRKSQENLNFQGYVSVGQTSIFRHYYIENVKDCILFRV